jgi:type IV secretory pathway VirB6-like protein
MFGVIRSPRMAFTAAAEPPRWIAVLALTFLVSLATNAALFETDVGRLALIDQWERTAVAFGQNLEDAQYEAIVRASRNGTAYAVISSVASGPILTLGVSTLLVAVFTGVLKGRASYRQVLAIVAHAGVILTLRQVIAAPLNYSRETLASPTTLNLFFGTLDEASPLARFLGVIDVFVVWWIVLLAIGMSVLYRRPARPLALTFIGVYIALAVVLAIAMAVTGGTA